MSKRFPVATYKDMVRAARKLGFSFARHAQGSHEIWRRERDGRQTTIPNHGNKPLKRKTVKVVLHDFGISVNAFRRMLRE